ncbi:MAG TPA: hypothetical protein VMV69_27555 [Pirellulales bacterium]|nr:hypothetical protein [Pirellulales bacterium]
MVCLALALGGRAPAAEPLLWELTPYRIRVYVALAVEPELTPRLASQLREAIVERTDTTIGSAWRLEALPAPPELEWPMLRSLATLSAESLPKELLELDFDKLMLLTVTARHGVYQVAARDYDLRARRAGMPISYVVPQRAKLCDEAFRALLTAFVPLARVEGMIEEPKESPPPEAIAPSAPPAAGAAPKEDKPRNKQALLRLRAAGLPPLDPSIVWVRPGDVFYSLTRTNDRDNKPKSIKAIDWTCLTVRSIAGAELTCDLNSGRRNPLGGRRRGRVEQLALLARAAGRSTRLEVWSRGDGKNEATKYPLAGYDVYSHPADSPKTVLIGRTDFQGAVTVPDDAGAVRVLLVMHGGEPLARLPLLAGVDPVLRAEILDDDERLEAEGLVHGMQENFVDLVARRQMLMARIHLRLDEGKTDEAKKLLDALRKLGRQEDFLSTIRQRKERTFSRDKATQTKIEKLFDDTEVVVNRFLTNSEVEKIEDEINAKTRGEPAPAAGGGA